MGAQAALKIFATGRLAALRSVWHAGPAPAFPACRNPADQMFIELAAVGRAQFLVTGDKDLLSKASSVSFAIVAADAFLGRFAASAR